MTKIVNWYHGLSDTTKFFVAVALGVFVGGFFF